MRDYGKVSPQFWTGATGKAIKAGGPDAVIVAMYLMTSPHANMIGLYHLPVLYIAHETGLTIEGASKGLARCSEALFCTYDEASEHVWVHEMAKFQIGQHLTTSDKRCKGVENELQKCPKGALQHAFRQRYSAAFHLEKYKPQARGFQAPPKPRAGAGAGTGAGTDTSNARDARSSDSFERFWATYPKKVGKDAARKAFERRKPDAATVDMMLHAVDVQSRSEQWRKDGGQFIPNPATWLNQGRWQDEPQHVNGAHVYDFAAGAI